MVQINWTPQAKEDLKGVVDYISLDSVQYAKLQVLRLRQSVIILKSHIYSGRIVPELDKKEFRELIEGNYRIVYKVVSKSRIDILAIQHSSRDFKKRSL